MAGVAIVGLAVAAGVRWTSGPDEAPPRLADGLAAGASTAVADAHARIREARPRPSVSSTPLASRDVAIEVHTTPPGATVAVGTARHGPTPVTIRLPVGAEPVELVVSMAGRATQKREVVPDKAHRLELVLLPNAAAAGQPPASTPTATKPFGRFD